MREVCIVKVVLVVIGIWHHHYVVHDYSKRHSRLSSPGVVLQRIWWRSYFCSFLEFFSIDANDAMESKSWANLSRSRLSTKCTVYVKPRFGLYENVSNTVIQRHALDSFSNSLDLTCCSVLADDFVLRQFAWATNGKSYYHDKCTKTGRLLHDGEVFANA